LEGSLISLSASKFNVSDPLPIYISQ